MNALGQPVLVDGLNEKGLAGGLLNAPNSAVYQKVGPAQSRRSIASYQLLTYVLTTCATVDEVRTTLPKILVNQSALGSYGGVVRIHMTVHDRNGKSLAVEYLNGQLVMRDNPTGVFTNDPPFEQHLATLGNYANLTPNEAPPLKMGGASFGPVSSGGGMAGVPGDMLSTSRFVRAALLSRYAPTNVTTAEEVPQAFHMLNNFDLPPGMIALAPGSSYGGGASKSSGGFEITEWMVVADQKNLAVLVGDPQYYSQSSGVEKLIDDFNEFSDPRRSSKMKTPRIIHKKMRKKLCKKTFLNQRPNYKT
jgi:choloylglycine hydrolase